MRRSPAQQTRYCIFLQLLTSLESNSTRTPLTGCTAAHYLLDVRPAGRWPARAVYYAGGVPRIMEEIKHMLHLDAMTVTGKNAGRNLEELKKSSYYEACDAYLQKTGLQRTDVIRSFDTPISSNGAIAVFARQPCARRRSRQAQRRTKNVPSCSARAPI